jgi:ribose/xylose/arabinose/galactoside ABC-type transport system permease subunit
MSELGRVIITLGVVLVVCGGLMLLLGRAGIPIGRLPGDIVYRGKNTTFYFPIVSCILISIVLTLISWIFHYFRR